MDKVEQYIKDNFSSFDAEMPPSGSRERFLTKVEQSHADRKSVKVRLLHLSLIATAAAVVLAVLLDFALPDVDREKAKAMLTMNGKETELIDLVKNVSPDEMELVMKSIRSITVEAIPLADQLPEELPAKERIRIIKEYYGRKTEALQKLMACYDVELK